MLTLRRFLCGLYGFLALVFVLIVPGHIFALLRPGSQGSLLPKTEWIVLTMTLLSLLVFGMAWWTMQFGKRWARAWAIVASIVLILTQAPLFYLWRSWFSFSLMIVPTSLLAVGIAGLVAFARPTGNVPVSPTKPPRVAGDGTSWLLDSITWLLGASAYIAGMNLWASWARALDLPMDQGLLFWPQLFGALALSITLHELGHAVTGLALGMKLRAFIVGPFHWHVEKGKWKFKFLPTRIFMQGGAAALVPTIPNPPDLEEVAMIAAGPVANLYTGVLAAWAALAIVDSPFEGLWHFLALFSTLSLVMFAVNLIPMRPETLYSDGARIYQILKGGPLADLHRATSITSASQVTPLRPRDYPITAIQRASSSFTQGHRGIFVRLIASNYFHDSGQITEARQSLAEAESIYEEDPSRISRNWQVVFIFGCAFLMRDAAKTRKWWNRMQEQKTQELDQDYYFAESSLLWIENRPHEAIEAWTKGNALVQQLPRVGAYDFDRDCFAQLRHVIDATSSDVQYLCVAGQENSVAGLAR